LSFFWHLGDKSSLLKFFSGKTTKAARKKKKKKEDFGAPKAKTNHHLKKLDALENTFLLVREEIDYNGGTCFV